VKAELERWEPRDEVIDSLVGLDGRELLKQDMAQHGSERHGREETWIGTSHGFYGSSYRSFRAYDQALQIPRNGKVVDLGAGPFRAAVYYGTERRDVEVVGYELLESRVQAGKNIVRSLGTEDRARIFQKDLSKPDLQLETADGYILMNPFPASTAEKIFRDLKRVAEESRKPFRVLIFNMAQDTLRVAQRQAWLRLVETRRSGEAKYGFVVYEVVPSRL
jgi:hypothetical protein